jgi:hypothetical protein
VDQPNNTNSPFAFEGTIVNQRDNAKPIIKNEAINSRRLDLIICKMLKCLFFLGVTQNNAFLLKIK